jgi:uncharacterized membrane protein
VEQVVVALLAAAEAQVVFLLLLHKFSLLDHLPARLELEEVFHQVAILTMAELVQVHNLAL